MAGTTSPASVDASAQIDVDRHPQLAQNGRHGSGARVARLSHELPAPLHQSGAGVQREGARRVIRGELPQ